MLDATAILQKADEQKYFEIHVNEDREEDNWTLKVKKPHPRKSQKWVNFMVGNFLTMADAKTTRSSDFGESSEDIGKHFIVDNLDQLLVFAEEILDLVESWEGLKAETPKQVKAFMMLSPFKAASFAIQFITDFHNWQIRS